MMGFFPFQEEYVVSPCSPHMTMGEFEKTATGLFQEYFENGDTQEVAVTLDELNIKNFKAEVRELNWHRLLKSLVSCL